MLRLRQPDCIIGILLKNDPLPKVEVKESIPIDSRDGIVIPTQSNLLIIHVTKVNSLIRMTAGREQ